MHTRFSLFNQFYTHITHFDSNSIASAQTRSYDKHAKPISEMCLMVSHSHTHTQSFNQLYSIWRHCSLVLGLSHSPCFLHSHTSSDSIILCVVRSGESRSHGALISFSLDYCRHVSVCSGILHRQMS